APHADYSSRYTRATGRQAGAPRVGCEARRQFGGQFEAWVNDRLPVQHLMRVRFAPRVAALRALGSRVRPGYAALLAAACLLVLLELPSFAMLDAWRPTGEAILLVCGLVASTWLNPRVARPLRMLWALLACVFLLVQVDRAVFLRFMGEEPLLYDQLFMIRH